MKRLNRFADCDRGAAAVELALILPLLMVILGGVIDFGFAFNAQISLTHAAREGVRVEAIGDVTNPTTPAATAAAAYSAPGATWLDPPGIRECPHPDGARLEARANYDFIILPFLSLTLSSQAVMRCNG